MLEGVDAQVLSASHAYDSNEILAYCGRQGIEPVYKLTKTKGSFAKSSLLKFYCMPAYSRHLNAGLTLLQLAIHFKGRLDRYIEL